MQTLMGIVSLILLAAIHATECQAANPLILTIRMATTHIECDTLDGIATIDEDRPWACVYCLPDDFRDLFTDKRKHSIVLVLPIKMHEDKGETESQRPHPPEVEKMAKNLYRRAEGGVDKYILIDGDNAFVSRSRTLIKSIQTQALTLTRREADDHILSIQFHYSLIPPSFRKILSNSVRETKKTHLDHEAAKAYSALIDDTVCTLLDGCETITVELNQIADSQRSLLSLKLSAAEGSELDDALKLLSPLGSRFAERLRPDASLNVAISYRAYDSLLKFLLALNPRIEPTAFKSLKENRDEFEKLKPAYEELREAVEIVMAMTFKLGRLDTVISFTNQQNGSTWTFSTFLPGAERISDPLSTFLKQAKPFDRVDAFEGNVGQSNGVAIHRLDKGYISVTEDCLAAASDAETLQQILTVETSHESRQSIPPILVEGDLVAIKPLLSAFNSSSLLKDFLSSDDPVSKGGRIRFAIETKDHSLLSNLALDQAATAHATVVASKFIFVPFCDFVGVRPKNITPSP